MKPSVGTVLALSSIFLVMLQTASAESLTPLATNCDVFGTPCNSAVTQVAFRLLPGSLFYLDFDLIGGSPPQGNTVTISSLITTETLGSFSQFGNVNGTFLNPPVVLTASTVPSVFRQQFTSPDNTPHLGLISFIIALSSSSVTGTKPDEFDIFLLDSTLTRTSTGDPSGMNAVVRGFFTPPNVTLFGTPFGVTLTPLAGVAEPSTFLLCALGVGWLVVCRKWPRRSTEAKRLVSFEPLLR
jgi:hypothetical protein